MDSDSKNLPAFSFTAWFFGLKPNENNVHENPDIWLNKVYKFVEEKDDEDAADLLLEKIDDLLIDHKIDECNNILEIIDLNKLSVNLIIVLLSSVRMAREVLPSYQNILEKIREHLGKMETEERLVGLLTGF